MSRKEAMAVYVEPEQAAKLRALSERTRVPMNVYIRVAIDRLLQREEIEAAPPPPEAA